MNWLKSGLSRRFALVMASLAVLPMLLLSQRVLRASERGIRVTVFNLQTKLAEEGADRIESWVAAADGRVQVALLAVDSLGESDRRRVLQRLVDGDAGIGSLAIVGRDARVSMSVSNKELSGLSTLAAASARAAAHRPASSTGRSAQVVRGESGPLLVLHYLLGHGSFARAVLPLTRTARLFAARVGETGFTILVDSKAAGCWSGRRATT